MAILMALIEFDENISSAKESVKYAKNVERSACRR